MRVAELKAIGRERGLRGYSRLKKAELIAFLQDNLQPSTRPPPMPAPRPPPAMCTRPVGPHDHQVGRSQWRLPRPIRGPRIPTPRRPPPPPPPSVRFRPDRPRQPELLRKLEERNPQPLQLLFPLAGCSVSTLKPYQLKTKRGKVEPPEDYLLMIQRSLNV